MEDYGLEHEFNVDRLPEDYEPVKLQDCDICGRPSHLHKGLCIQCKTTYQPLDFEEAQWPG